MKRVLLVLTSLVFSSLLIAEEEPAKQRAIYYTMSPAFVSNFGMSERKLSYIKAEVSLKVENEALLEKVKSNEALVRHHIVMLLSAQSKQEMGASSAQESIRLAALSRVKEALAEELGKTGVEDLLFTSFVVQI